MIPYGLLSALCFSKPVHFSLADFYLRSIIVIIILSTNELAGITLTKERHRYVGLDRLL